MCFSSAKLKACQAENNVLRAQVAVLQDRVDELIGSVTQQQEIISLMEDGPGAPKTTPRVLTWSVLNQKLLDVFGERYPTCPTKLFSDADWLVSTVKDVQFYIDYYSMFWLPKISPYKVVEWTKLDGTKVRIWARDCDDFSDFLQGVPTMHLDWVGLPWGIMWAEIEGAFISGYHAFNWTVTMKEGFDELDPDGLDMWLIEPQGKNSMWVPTSQGDISITVADRLVAQPMAAFKVKSIGMIKV